MHERVCAGECLGDARKRGRAVDEDFEVATLAHRRVALGPEDVPLRVELGQLSDAPEPTVMVSTDSTLKTISRPRVESV